MRSDDLSDSEVVWAASAERDAHPLSHALPVAPEVWSDDNSPQELAIHYHEGIEAGIMLGGRLERRWGTFSYEAAAGDTWLVPMWEPHAWRTITQSHSEVVLHFLPEFLSDLRVADVDWFSLFAAPPNERPRPSSAEQRAQMLAIGREMRRETEERAPGRTTALQLSLLRMLLCLLRSWNPDQRPGIAKGTISNKLSRISPALELLRERGPARVGVLEAAAACRVNRTTFSRLFRETMGISFGQFRLRTHLAQAAQHLVGSDLSVDSIAAEAGFSDASHLSHAFAKHYGCTPGEYRARYRG